ncbi:riboflavin synthase [Alphaproteobacteria bacterium HT1-32]|nr:riboflavin synthase [Alphaproteobacteria bacterium HT1-32]
MFTGIITDIGCIADVIKREGEDLRFHIQTSYDVASIDLGASIACSGCCLTAVDFGSDWFAVDVSGETLSKTTLGNWKIGQRINLERSLKVGDELGGHIVSGHVDGVATIADIQSEDGSHRFTFDAPRTLARFVAQKGSVALDGASLTVNDVSDTKFGVNIIPHTAVMTTFGDRKTGDRVNMEIDVLARYVARLSEMET